MTAQIVVDVIQGQIAMACKECGTTGEFLEDRPGNRVVVGNMVSLHNTLQHWTNPLEEFKPSALRVSAEDFTEFLNGAEEVTTPDKALKILDDALRIKTLRIKQLETDAEQRETLITEMRQTIQELLETPEPMPLCKNPEGHNYIPLDQMFVFCTRCGHSIHYKSKG